MWVVDSLRAWALSFPWLPDLLLTGKRLWAAYGRDRMSVLLSLSVSSVTLALCQAACFSMEPKGVIRNGVLVIQKHCLDPFDGSSHPPGSKWNTAHCMKCHCLAGEMRCCHRYGGVVIPPEGCRAVVNPETCTYEMYRTDKHSEPCF